MDNFDRPWMYPIDIGVDTDENRKLKLLPNRGLKLIGIRFYKCTHVSREVERKAINIQKNLYGHDWLYFNKGFKIIEKCTNDSDMPNISYIKVEEGAFDSSFLLYSQQNDIVINFSAIIGQNGTGKSTIVDTIIRLINNLSAAIIGECYVYSSAQHLHYIDNLYASLAVYKNNEIKILTCLGKKLFITSYKANIEELNKSYNTDGFKDETIIEYYHMSSTTLILSGSEPCDELLQPNDGFKSILNDWFYTLIGNYSLYAYNYRDYYSERTNEEKLKQLRLLKPEDTKTEDEVWLKGVFHKNDGYQTPIVIHPMRTNGYVNAAKVNYLGKQNLISLAFVKAKDSQTFPFRTINNTHHLVAFYFYPSEVNPGKNAVDGIMSQKFDLSDSQKLLFCSLDEPIKKFWGDAIGVTYNDNLNLVELKAWNYLVYKTIKIFWNYKHYENAWKCINGNCPLEKLTSYLYELLKDSSHRTLKLRQVLSFLRFKNDKDYYLNKGCVVDLETINDWMHKKIGHQLYLNSDFHPITIEDLLPPPYPILNVELQLIDNEHLEEYRKIGNRSLNIIPFEGLSSGERQIAYSLGNVIYHLKNIESAMNDFNIDISHLQSLKYKYVNIMLDEVELYFHPDLQRRFVSLLIDAIYGLKFDSICGINVTLITHSPFVLSDIPLENIMSLSRNEIENLNDSTFAANIHDLFNNTFFLPYTIGELAKREIENIVDYYNNWKRSSVQSQRRCIKNESVNCLRKRTVAKMKYIASIVGDDYLRDEIIDMLEETEDNLKYEKD